MPYDSSLDKCIASKAWESENGRIIVSVYSYNNGPRKLQIARENRTNDGELRFGKLGRMNKEEVEAVLPLINELLPQI